MQYVRIYDNNYFDQRKFLHGCVITTMSNECTCDCSIRMTAVLEYIIIYYGEARPKSHHVRVNRLLSMCAQSLFINLSCV